MVYWGPKSEAGGPVYQRNFPSIEIIIESCFSAYNASSVIGWNILALVSASNRGLMGRNHATLIIQWLPLMFMRQLNLRLDMASTLFMSFNMIGVLCFFLLS